MRVGKEKTKEHLALVRKAISRNPNASILQIRDLLANIGYKLDKNYIHKLMKKIRSERAVRYDRAAKNEAIAKFDDFLQDMSDELNKIVSNPENQKSKIMAIRTLVGNYKTLLDLQFDMGVFERNLGKMKNEVVNVGDILKIINDTRRENQDTNKSG